MNNYILCSYCFNDFGLKSEADKLGIREFKICPNCKNIGGKKLNHKELIALCSIYFVNGTFHRTNFGGASIVIFNEYQQNSIEINQNLQQDLNLISKSINIGFFYNAPNTNLVGEREPIKKLLSKYYEREILKIIKIFPTIYLGENDNVFRLRINPKSPEKHEEYDSPPTQYRKNGRFNNNVNRIFYAAFDAETTIYECRSKVNDELYLSISNPTMPIKVIDFSCQIQSNDYNVDSFNDFINDIFNSDSKEAYIICRRIAKKLLKDGYEGVIYTSYFNHFKTSKTKNLALFGFPIKEGKIKVKCINKILLNKVRYDFTYGPLLETNNINHTKI